MGKLLLEFGLFAAGLILFVTFCQVAKSIKRGEKLPAPLRLLTKVKLHYSLAGLLVGVLIPSAVHGSSDALIRFVLVFIGGWFGLVAGCGLDLRVLRRGAALPLIFESVQSVLVAALALLIFYLSENFIEGLGNSISGPVLLVICGMVVLGGKSLHWFQPPRVSRDFARQGTWQGSLTAFWGVLLVGLGSFQLNATPVEADYPFLAIGKIVISDGVLGKLFWSLVLGGLIGLAGDLLTRDVEGHPLFYFMLGLVLLGSGVAASMGLEPVWVGMVSGLWLINATLQRLDIIGVLEGTSVSAQSALLFVVGWLLGTGLMRYSIDWTVFFWVLLLLFFLRPLARLLVLLIANRAWVGHEAKRADRSARNWLIPDELALVIAAGMSKVIPPSAGLAVLGSVLAGYVLLLLFGGKVENLLNRLPAVANRASGEG